MGEGRGGWGGGGVPANGRGEGGGTLFPLGTETLTTGCIRFDLQVLRQYDKQSVTILGVIQYLQSMWAHGSLASAIEGDDRIRMKLMAIHEGTDVLFHSNFGFIFLEINLFSI